MPKSNLQKKTISQILGIFLLVLGIGAGIVLVTEPQNFKQKAFDPTYTPGCKNGPTGCSADSKQLLTCLEGITYPATCSYGCTNNTFDNSFACRSSQTGGIGSGGFDTPCTTEVYKCPGTIGDAGVYGGVCFDTPNDGCPTVEVAAAFAVKKPATPLPTPIPTPRPTPVPTVAPTPTLAPVGQITKKVLVLNFDPLINGTTPLHTYKGWNDPVTLQNQYITDVKSASHQYVNYQIVNTQVVRDYPTKIGGFKFTEAQFLGCFTDSTPSYCMQMIDYNKVLTDYAVCEQLNSGTIDELWLWGAPYFGYFEAAMAGPGAFWINGPVITNTTCQKKLPIMGFNYERTVVEMMHDLGHRAENVMVKVFGTWAIDLNTAWNRFSMPNKDMAGKSSCGNVHFPANGVSDYDYNNQTYVNSRCEDWLNYPSIKGEVLQLNCNSWNCGGTYFEKYWLLHFPFALGTTNGKLNNWWAYLVDFDNAVARSTYDNEKWFVIENGVNDQNVSCGTDVTGPEVYFGVNAGCSPATNYVGKFSFPGINLPKNTTITDAYLEFVADGPYSNSITENIVLSDGTATSIGTTWNINTNWTSGSIVKSPTLTAVVQQIVNGASWTNGGTITVSVNHVSGTGSRRVFAFDREALAGARLVIKTGILPTPPPTPTPTPTPSPTPSLLPSLNYDKRILNPADDYHISGCGQVGHANEVYMGLDTFSGCSTVQPYNGFFVFKDVNLNRNATVTNSYIEFMLDGPYSTPMVESIVVSDGTTTSTAVNWPISENWISSAIGKTPSLNAAIQQVLAGPSWTPGKSLTFRISHVSGNTTRRVFAYERGASTAARLVINTTFAPPTPTPTPNMVPPTLLIPNNNSFVNPTGQVFDWTDVAGAIGYDFQLSWVPEFTPYMEINTSTTLSKYISTKTLNGSTKYYWRVRSKFQNGVSAWSSTFAFTGNYPPASPRLSYPADGSMVSSTKPLLTWGGSGSAAGIVDYYLQVASTRDFTNLVVNSHLGVTNSYQFTTALSPNTQYYWRVQAKDSIDQLSTYWTFSTFFTPATNATSQTVTYQVASSADDYQFNCGGGTTVTDTTLTLGQMTGCATSVGRNNDIIFRNVQIPKYSAIIDAHLEMVASGTNTSNFTLFQNVYSGTGGGLADSNEWVINTNWTNGSTVSTANFANPLNSITSYTGWKQGDPVMLRLSYKSDSGTGTRVVKAYDGGSTTAPKLVVTYIPKPTIAPTPTPVPVGTASCTITLSPLTNMSNQQVLTVGQLEQTTSVTANVTATGGTVTNVTFEPQPFWTGSSTNFDVCNSASSICPTYSKVYTDTTTPFNAKITSQYNHNFGPLKVTAVMNTGHTCTTTVMMGGTQPVCFSYKDQNGNSYSDAIPWNFKSGNTYTMTPTKANAADVVNTVLWDGAPYDAQGVYQSTGFSQAYPLPVTYKPVGNYTTYSVIAGRPNMCKQYTYYTVK